MSELAFNLNGERFAVPSDASGWRVRRLKPGGRGQPEVVFGDDGAPLIVPIECDLEGFRRCVRQEPGRYRLDPVDVQLGAVDGGFPAYLQLAEQVVSSSPAPVNDQLVRDLARANADMVRVMTEKFAGVMEAAAQLIRAADGAGLPAREPMAPPPPALRNAAPVEPAKDEDEPEEGHQLTGVLMTAVDRAMPVVNHAINTKILGLSQEQSFALLGATPPPPPASPANANEVELETGEPSGDEELGDVDGDALADDATELTEPVADFGAHLQAIEKELTVEEVGLARHAVLQMQPDVLADWRLRLMRLSPGAAAALIRAEVYKGASRASGESGNSGNDGTGGGAA